MEKQDQIIEIASQIIKGYEGLELEAYLCPAGVLTIGWGHLVREGYDSHTITREQAKELLRHDIKAKLDQLRPYTDGLGLEPHQEAALLSFVFNFGIGAYARSKLRKCVEAGDTKGVIANLIEFRNATVKGKFQVLKGLVFRRASEAGLYMTGVYIHYTLENEDDIPKEYVH